MCTFFYMTFGDIDNQNALFSGFPGNSRCMSWHLWLKWVRFQMWVWGLSAATGKVRFCQRQLGVSSHFRETAVPEMSRDRTQTNQLRKRSDWIDSLPFHDGGEAHTHTHTYTHVVSCITMLNALAPLQLNVTFTSSTTCLTLTPGFNLMPQPPS